MSEFTFGFLLGAGLFCWKAILDIQALRAELDAVRAEHQRDERDAALGARIRQSPWGFMLFRHASGWEARTGDIPLRMACTSPEAAIRAAFDGEEGADT